jgi:hypothetical protein
MSCGCTVPKVTFVVPTIEFPSPEAVADQVVEQSPAAVVPAATGLGALSGALLAGRAAMTGPQALAAAALRATEARHEQPEEAERAHRSQPRWQDAVFAVCRANARLDVLRARVRRATPPGGEAEGAPPLPEPPTTLDPVGLRLDQIHAWLAVTEQAVRRVEAELARWALASASPVREDGGRADAAQRLRGRRERALAAYAEARTEREAGRALPSYASLPPHAPALTADLAIELGEELLAGLDVAVPAAAYDQIQDQVAHVVELAPERPADALLLLSGARDLAYAANWRAADRRETAEWAAQQSHVLRQPHAEPGTAPSDVLATLERIVERGDPVDPRLRAEISARVAARQAELERTYVARLLLWKIAERASGARATVRQPAPGVELIEWAPPERGTEHWLRIALDAEGTVRVRTVHLARQEEAETAQAEDSDRERCEEAGRHLARLVRETADAGVVLDLVFDEMRTVADRRPDGREAPTYRCLRHDDRDGDRRP